MATAANRGSLRPRPNVVAVVSFLAGAGPAPVGGFWIALAGGVALATDGPSAAARGSDSARASRPMLETVAIIGPGPLRPSPLTQAATAPMLGRLEARGWRPAARRSWPAGPIRLIHNTATTAFFIWVNHLAGLDGLPRAPTTRSGHRLGIGGGQPRDALLLTLASLLVWAAFASTVQVARLPAAGLGPVGDELAAPRA